MMSCNSLASVATLLLLLGPWAAIAHDNHQGGDQNNNQNCGVKPICKNVIPDHVSVDGRPGCKRYTSGFDITGTTNFVQFAVNNVCDCIHACFQARTTCDNWVYKFVDNSGHRKCTLYSNFNQPPNTVLGIKKSLSNLGVIAATPQGNNFVQAGGLVPHCQFFDNQGNAHGFDPDCKSGGMFLLDNPFQQPGVQSNRHFISC